MSHIAMSSGESARVKMPPGPAPEPAELCRDVLIPE
jgi:hypothetical protein